MTDSNQDYVYDEESGEWLPASELAQRQHAAVQPEVRDAVGNLLAHALGQPVSSIQIVRGETGRTKVVRIGQPRG